MRDDALSREPARCVGRCLTNADRYLLGQSPTRRATRASLVDVPAPVVEISTLYASSDSTVMAEVERAVTDAPAGALTVHSALNV